MPIAGAAVVVTVLGAAPAAQGAPEDAFRGAWASIDVDGDSLVDSYGAVFTRPSD